MAGISPPLTTSNAQPKWPAKQCDALSPVIRMRANRHEADSPTLMATESARLLHFQAVVGGRQARPQM